MGLDHVFVFVDDGPAAERAAVDAGLVPTHRRRHRGQGTQNVCFGFGSAFIEFLWVVDRSEISSGAVRRTGLWPRSQWRTTGACPFGVCLSGSPSFATWTYDVPFPQGVSVEMAENSESFEQPLLFVSPSVGLPRKTAQPLGSAITAVVLQFPSAVPLRVPELTAAGVSERPGSPPRVMITIDGGLKGKRVDIPDGLLRLYL